MSSPNFAFKQRIVAKYGSEAEMARCIKWSRQRLNKITNGIKIPDVDEISVMASALGLSISTTAKFFLANQSPNKQQKTRQSGGDGKEA